jgi:hypothetical protein
MVLDSVVPFLQLKSVKHLTCNGLTAAEDEIESMQGLPFFVTRLSLRRSDIHPFTFSRLLESVPNLTHLS